MITVPSRLSISSWRSASTIEGKQSVSYSLDGCQMLHYGARFSVRVSDPLDTAVPLATLRALPKSMSVAGTASVLHFNLYVVSKHFDGMFQHAWFSSTRRQGYFFDNMSYSARSRLQDYARDCSALCDFHARISQVVGADSSSTPLSCIVLLACDWYRSFPPLSRSNSTVRGGTWTECTSVELLLSSVF